MRKRRGKRKHAFYIPMTKESIDETCEIRHEIGRAGRACVNCIYCEVCGRREDK